MARANLLVKRGVQRNRLPLVPILLSPASLWNGVHCEINILACCLLRLRLPHIAWASTAAEHEVRVERSVPEMKKAESLLFAFRDENKGLSRCDESAVQNKPLLSPAPGLSCPLTPIVQTAAHQPHHYPHDRMQDRLALRGPVLGADPGVGEGDGDTTHERSGDCLALASVEQGEDGDAGAEVARGDEGDEGQGACR